MEPSGHSVRSLSALPADVLGLILSYDQVSHLVVRLWKAGDPRLNARLAVGVTKVELRRLTGFNTLLPSVLSQLRGLTHLVLKSSLMFFLQPSYWFSALRALPNSLTCLEIMANDTDLAFLNYGANYASTTYERGESSCIDLGALFPRLATLKLRKISLELLPALPSTLTALSFVETDFTNNFVHKLPKSLQLLDIDLTIELEDSVDANSGADSYPLLDQFANAPTGMELSNMILTASTDADSWASLVPRGLRSLTLEEGSTLTPSILSQFPSSLTRLKIVELGELNWNLFVEQGHGIWPSNLLSLDLHMNGLQTGYLAATPRTLTTLDIHFYFGYAPRPQLHAEELPPLLRRLNIYGEAPYILNGMLPESITDFGWGQLEECPATSWKALPTSITQLSTHKLCFFSAELADSWGSYVPNLKVLDLAECTAKELALVPRTVTKLTIKVLNGSTVDESDSTFNDLPDTLLSLSIDNIYDHQDYSSLKRFYLLEELSLPFILRLSTALVLFLPKSLKSLAGQIAFGDAKYLADLPPNLTSCQLGYGGAQIAQYEEYCPITALDTLTTTYAKAERVRQRYRALDL